MTVQLALRTLDESEPAVASSSAATGHLLRALTLTAYAVLGSILCWSHLYGLDRSYWHDEILTVEDFVTAGPNAILAGPYIANNHELFSLLSWTTSSLVGESEVLLRLGSVIPFVLGVVIVTAWLDVRIGALEGVLFLYFATLSPLLLDVTRQARGYGLAFLAMSVLVVAALEAERTGRTAPILVCCAAGLVGTWTLPNFGIAYVATAGVLLTNRQLRRRVAVVLFGSLVATTAWYAPHFDDLFTASRQHWGTQIPWFGIVTAPFDRVLIPAMLWIDNDTTLTTSVASLSLVAAVAIVALSSPLLRQRRTAAILGSGVVASLLLAWATRFYLSPRYVSFLLVPLFVLLASGAAHLVRPSRRSRVGAAITLIVLALPCVAFVSAAWPVTQLPREAHRDAARAILKGAPPRSPVLAYTFRPRDLEFYLGRSVQPLQQADVTSRVCGNSSTVVYVQQPLGQQPVTVPCLRNAAVRHFRFEQYSEGGEINVWVVPPRS